VNTSPHCEQAHSSLGLGYRLIFNYRMINQKDMMINQKEEMETLAWAPR
jgi:hypothetical protein